MKEDITILTAFLLSNIPEIITQEEFDEVKQAIENLIKGYRELEERIIYLVNERKKLEELLFASNENYIEKSKVKEKIEELNKNELLCKMNFENIKFTIEVLQELMEE